uniref:PH domain-containing protein n=1 Tax=Anisakis simplex TaxID=6269 RepID=A0A0M3JE31_ANISI
LLQFTDALNTTISTAPKQQLTTTIPSASHAQHVQHSQHPNKNRSSSLAPNDILSWKEHLLARYRGCSSLLLNNTGRISEAERNELEAYLKDENLAEYK